jgi:trans-2,3-dihydro-3-hydroxyanthranilate isomerase
MASYRYVHLDVFTHRPFEGNQLAVFLDGRGLDARQMQAIAREMNFSESTFILPAEAAGTDVRMRIFTPGQELPMAGHPTIGSTFALAGHGTIAPGREHFVFGLGVGPTRVELTWKANALDFVWMDQPRPDVRQPASSAADIIRAAGLDAAAVERTGLPIEEISCGVPYILIPVDRRAAVDAAAADMAVLDRLRSAFDVPEVGLYIFSVEAKEADVTVYSRMFAPGFGIVEDPATGSASGPLGCYLVAHQVVPADRARAIVNLQGVKMGRPSRLHIAIDADGGAITRVQVGGQAVTVGEGTIQA